MMDYSKLYCQEHPYELITNFCAEGMLVSNVDECLVGLCANCICTHTEIHVRKGTCPKYQNIKETFARVNECLRSQIDKI